MRKQVLVLLWFLGDVVTFLNGESYEFREGTESWGGEEERVAMCVGERDKKVVWRS